MNKNHSLNGIQKEFISKENEAYDKYHFIVNEKKKINWETEVKRLLNNFFSIYLILSLIFLL